MASFGGKVIAITGGASGIGLALSKILHERGAKISIADVNQESLEKALKEIDPNQDRAMVCQCDIRNLDQVHKWLKQTVDRFGKLDGAANMAGVISNKREGHGGGSGLIENQDEDDWERIIGINLTVNSSASHQSLP